MDRRGGKVATATGGNSEIMTMRRPDGSAEVVIVGADAATRRTGRRAMGRPAPVPMHLSQRSQRALP